MSSYTDFPHDLGILGINHECKFLVCNSFLSTLEFLYSPAIFLLIYTTKKKVIAHPFGEQSRMCLGYLLVLVCSSSIY